MTAHTGIGKFNTNETYPNQSLDNDLCQVVHAGNTLCAWPGRYRL